MKCEASTHKVMILQLRDLVRSCEKLNTLYLRLHWISGHKT